MVRKIIIIFLFSTLFLRAQEVQDRNIYENNCLSCHQFSSLKLDKIFFSYLIKYSSELSVKAALIDFLKNPNLQTSVMSEDELRRLGLKTKTNLDDEKLKEAIDIYWELYDVSNRLW